MQGQIYREPNIRNKLKYNNKWLVDLQYVIQWLYENQWALIHSKQNIAITEDIRITHLQS